jgi:hypothetical protein
MRVGTSDNPFETVGKTWAAIGLAASLFSLVFLMRSVQREEDTFWRGIGIGGIVGAGISVYGSASKVLS